MKTNSTDGVGRGGGVISIPFPSPNVPNAVTLIS